MHVTNRHLAAERSFVALLALYLQRTTKIFGQYTALTRSTSGPFTFTHSSDATGTSQTFELENRTGNKLLDGISVYFPARDPQGSYPPDSTVNLPIEIHIYIETTVRGFSIAQARLVAFEIGSRIFGSPGTTTALNRGRVELYDIGSSSDMPALLGGFLVWHFQGQPRWRDETLPSEGGAHLILSLSASYRA